MKIAYLLSLFSLLFMAGCATEAYVAVPEPEPIVYYGWYGAYYGPWYYGPSGVIVFGAPHNWHGYYHPHPRFEPPHHFAPAPTPRLQPVPVPPRHNPEPPRHNPRPPNGPPHVPPRGPMPHDQPQPR